MRFAAVRLRQLQSENVNGCTATRLLDLILLVLKKSQRLCSRTSSFAKATPQKSSHRALTARLCSKRRRSLWRFPHRGAVHFRYNHAFPRLSLELNVRVFQAKRDTHKHVGYVREVLAKSWNNGIQNTIDHSLGPRWAWKMTTKSRCLGRRSYGRRSFRDVVDLFLSCSSLTISSENA